MESPLRRLRIRAGLTQLELAERAGVSRQLVGAVEVGRHLPRVDAALALASALDADVADLFGPSNGLADILSGGRPGDGTLVRSGRVGDTQVTAPVRMGPDGWDVADAIVEDGRLDLFHRHDPGLVVAGCEPGLEVLERLLREAGMTAVAASASTAAAIKALAAGRVHAAVVHGRNPSSQVADLQVPVHRYALSRWQVGLAAPQDAPKGWVRAALTGAVPVVQREAGAGVQRAFERVAEASDIPGPRVSTHLAAARHAVLTERPAVTIEPAALALGAAFHPIETHEAELWLAIEWKAERFALEALTVLASAGYQRRLLAIGGYDLDGTGTRVA